MSKFYYRHNDYINNNNYDNYNGVCVCVCVCNVYVFNVDFVMPLYVVFTNTSTSGLLYNNS